MIADCWRPVGPPQLLRSARLLAVGRYIYRLLTFPCPLAGRVKSLERTIDGGHRSIIGDIARASKAAPSSCRDCSTDDVSSRVGSIGSIQQRSTMELARSSLESLGRRLGA